MIELVTIAYVVLMHRPLGGDSVRHGIEFLAAVHELEWTEKDSEAVAAMSPWVLKMREEELPHDSQYRFGPCDGTTVLYRSSDRFAVNVEFDERGRATPCERYLRAVRLDFLLDAKSIA